MRNMLRVGTFLAGMTIAVRLTSAHAETALDAVKQLPKDDVSRIAKIEGREGTPEPDRWYIVTHDPAAENGVHEFVVCNGEIVASRGLSQFAESLKPEDIIVEAALKVDSDKAEKLAHDYAERNGTAVATMNYELKKDGPDGAAAWTISCMDGTGTKVGELVLTAGKGEVVSHEGFAMEPKATPESTPRKKIHVEPVTVVAPVAGSSPAAAVAPAQAGTTPKKSGNPIGRTFDSVGRTLHKLLPF